MLDPTANANASKERLMKCFCFCIFFHSKLIDLTSAALLMKMYIVFFIV